MNIQPLHIEASQSVARRIEGDEGLEMRIVTDTEEYLSIAVGGGKAKTTPEMLSPREDDLNGTEPVFILLMDGEDLAATIGLRSWIVDRPFIRFLNALYSPLYCKHGSAIEAGKLPPVFREISGSACYVGEFFIAKPWQRRISIGDLALCAYAEAIERWDPDWFWGYVREPHAQIGLPIRYHGARSYRQAVSWKVENPYHRSGDRFVCSNREDIAWVLATSNEAPVSGRRFFPSTT